MVDTCVSQASIDFQCCLKLPQSIYDPSTGTIVPQSAPRRVTKCVDNQQSLPFSRENLLFDNNTPKDSGSDSDFNAASVVSTLSRN